MLRTMPTKIKTKPTAKNALSDKSRKKRNRRSSDEIWDELLTTPESEAFLMMMVADVRKEEGEGKLVEGGWDEI